MDSVIAVLMAPSRPRSRSMAATPNAENQRMVNAVGRNSTPSTNSRMVRPLLMRATKMPTNGAQVMVQAQ